MRLSLDPKPIGAFIEYTLKPLIDDSRELLEIADKHGITGNTLLRQAFMCYLLHNIINLLTNLLVTGMICFTVLKCLHTRL